jgi:hypothetical protein
MSDLSPQARALLEASAEGDDPSAADRARIRSALALRIGTGALVGGGIATASSSVGAAVIAAKVVKALVVMGLVFGAGALPWGDAERQDETVAVTTPAGGFVEREAFEHEPPPRVAPTAAAFAEDPVVELEAVDAMAPAPAAPLASAPVASVAGTSTNGTSTNGTSPGATSTGATSTRATARASGATGAEEPTAQEPSAEDLDAETALLRRARVAIRNGDVGAALAILAQHAGEFPKGQLRNEREALRVLALCRAGKTAEAKEAATPFLAGNSPLAVRIRESCAGTP